MTVLYSNCWWAILNGGFYYLIPRPKELGLGTRLLSISMTYVSSTGPFRYTHSV